MAPLEAMQAAVLPPAVASNLAELLSLGALLLLKGVHEHWKDGRRDKKHSAELTEQLEDVSTRFEKRCDGIERSVATLSAHVIGPDGENGIRGDVRELKVKMEGFERRERDRLERKAYDRRSGT